MSDQSLRHPVPADSGRRRWVAAVGVAHSDCGRVDHATAFQLYAQAARRALADSGLPRSVIDGVASAGLGLLAPVEICEYRGLRPAWTDSTAVGGSTWAADPAAGGQHHGQPATAIRLRAADQGQRTTCPA
jgi:hypothetical protein